MRGTANNYKQENIEQHGTSVNVTVANGEDCVLR